MALPPPLPGLMPASFRGIGFYAPDVSSEVGRRIAAHYFPGLDIAAYDDHGKSPEKITITGMYVGDDYIAHGKAPKAELQAFCNQSNIKAIIADFRLKCAEAAITGCFSFSRQAYARKLQRLLKKDQASLTAIKDKYFKPLIGKMLEQEQQAQQGSSAPLPAEAAITP
ncbi:MAG: hypothetical protein DU429_01900 [Candidatus Tokpelaia sp.]|nr:MAG: hypothetical protein DU430_03615 [Candidatus Tokpelaia sp.]KAA6207262.1 MAG: hypothetical protein DU429_01900 [Candidatus Tokpelaia sp.]